tara:strand:- start:250 stop:435 length:186 start_codon:yes stop_codon:yes gene_type:complete
MIPPYNSKDNLAKIHVDFGINKYHVWFHKKRGDIEHLAAFEHETTAMAYISAYNTYEKETY